ncbi:MAG TPA: dihydrolipoamide acetyltransferase family protein [Baekduia sp.]
MTTQIAMPRLSDSMEEGTIVRWLVDDGATVAEGDEIVEIETDKATMPFEAESAGVLAIIAHEGETIAVGAPLAQLAPVGSTAPSAPPTNGASAPATAGDGAGTSALAPASGGAATSAPAAASGDATPSALAAPDGGAAPSASVAARDGGMPAASGAASGGATSSASAPASGDAAPSPAAIARGAVPRVAASPLARRVARERGIDLGSVRGSGRGGRIVRADVEGAVVAPPEVAAPRDAAPAAGAKGEVEVVELSRMQATVARRMAEAKATIPEFVLSRTVAMDAAVELRTMLRAAAPEAPVPSYNDMVVRACALALRAHPRANGAYRDGRFELYGRVNVGIAVAAGDALLVPTIFDADVKSLGTIGREARALAGKCRDGAITPPELSGGTFAVSNLGMFGVDRFTAVINPPQAAILAVGALRREPVVRDDALAIGHVMEITLTCDHRILYGAQAAELLGDIAGRLERPIALLL